LGNFRENSKKTKKCGEKFGIRENFKKNHEKIHILKSKKYDEKILGTKNYEKI